MSQQQLEQNAKQSKSIVALFQQSSVLYFKNIGVLTPPIILPVVFQVIGIVLAMGLPLYCAIFFQQTMLQYPFIARQGAIVLLSLPGVILMSVALWHYLVWMVALCHSAKALLSGEPLPDFKRAYKQVHQKRYSKLLIVLSVLWLLGLIVYGLGMLSTRFIEEPMLGLIVSLASLAALLMGVVFAAVASVFFCLSFQAFAFKDNERTSTWTILKSSVTVVRSKLFSVLVFSIIFCLMTGLLLPELFNQLLHLTGISQWLAEPLRLPIQTYFANIQSNVTQAIPNPLIQSFFIEFIKEVSSIEIAITIVDEFIASTITLLLLPWGTIGFTALYLDER